MIYAIGDIHGQKKMLDRALVLIAADGGAAAPLVFLGDYTDRGPDSRCVIDELIRGRDAGFDWTCIKGNHDRMFTRFVRDGIMHDPAIRSGLCWLNPRLGGDTTLASYGIVPTAPATFAKHDDGLEYLVSYPTTLGDLSLDDLVTEAQARVPEPHLNALESSPLMHETDGQLFVHAGIRPGVALARQTEDDLIWIRDGWLNNTDDHGLMVVHGHTAMDHPEHFGNRIDLDGGAGYGRPLVPAVFDGGQWFTLDDDGRTPLRPGR